MKSRILAIATWSGKRRWQHPSMVQDPGYYVHRQVASLRAIAHRLDEVVFVVPRNDREPKDFTRAINGLPRRIRSARVTVLRRKRNFAMSYGSWLHVMRKRPDADYILLLEDDYLFHVDSFDDELIDCIEGMRGCGYLCGLTCMYEHPLTTAREIRIAAISNGVVARAAASAVIEKLDENLWPVRRLDRHMAARYQAQVAFSALFEDVCTLRDVRGRYRVFFRDSLDGSVRSYHDENDPVLMGPL